MEQMFNPSSESGNSIAQLQIYQQTTIQLKLHYIDQTDECESFGNSSPATEINSLDKRIW